MPEGTLIYKIGENDKIKINTFFDKPLSVEEKNLFKNLFISLTSNQKLCFLFLMCIIKKNLYNTRRNFIRKISYC